METPVRIDLVKAKIREFEIKDVGRSSIREMVRLVNSIEKESGVKFFRMEMGVPGLPSSKIGLNAEIDALKNGVSSIYPPIEGIPQLKYESSRFLKLFADADFSPGGCIPTTGSMEASMSSIMVINRLNKDKNKILYIDPGFPVHKLQVKTLDIPYESFDIYNFRGSKLKVKLEKVFAQGDIAAILYSNPNNPSWICLSENELKSIAELSEKYNVIVLEDLAYFGMDLRNNISKPGEPPYQPTVRRYTDNCILLISGSKIFSYAGQRIGVMAITDELFNRKSENLIPFFGTDEFGHAIIYGSLYSMTAGTAHSAQYAIHALLKAANDGTFNFVEEVREYESRARIMKSVFLDNGFYLVYDKDEERSIGDGFYFTVNYPGFTSGQIMEELLYYGISSVTLDISGSEKDGIRACVSQFRIDQQYELRRRLSLFREHHPRK